MAFGDPKGNFGATGGYGGNFNSGGGGLHNISGSAGGNPMNWSGGVGNYGAAQAAANRLGQTPASMNAAANAAMNSMGYVVGPNGTYQKDSQRIASANSKSGGDSTATSGWATPTPKQLAQALSPPIPQPKPGFGVADPYSGAYSNVYSGMPGFPNQPEQGPGNVIGGYSNTGLGPRQNPAVNRTGMGDYQGGGVAVGGRGISGMVR